MHERPPADSNTVCCTEGRWVGLQPGQSTGTQWPARRKSPRGGQGQAEEWRGLSPAWAVAQPRRKRRLCAYCLHVQVDRPLKHKTCIMERCARCQLSTGIRGCALAPPTMKLQLGADRGATEWYTSVSHVVIIVWPGGLQSSAKRNATSCSQPAQRNLRQHADRKEIHKRIRRPCKVPVWWVQKQITTLGLGRAWGASMGRKSEVPPI